MPKKLPPPPPMGSLSLRKTLSVPVLLAKARTCFAAIVDHRNKRPTYPLADVLMSGLALFSLKDASLLQFDQQRNDPHRRHNLHRLFGITKVPCDSQLRKVLDEVEPQQLRPVFRQFHQELQRQGVLEDYRFLGKYLVSIDGTGTFSSNEVSCSDCCEKHHKDGTVEYYHQLLGAVIVHPKKSTVLPFYPEAITRQDGVKKNDCEHNASQRLLPLLRDDFPRLEMIVLQDALSCNGPHLKRLKALGYSFIVTSKHDLSSLLLKQVMKGLETGSTVEITGVTEQGWPCGYRYANQLPLNSSHKDLFVNYIDYWEERPNQKPYLYACVTDIALTADNVADVVLAGRARWKVENETFNTLKNLGYHLEHNYGHGKKHLSTVFATLMMLAFFIDQIQEATCHYFQAVRSRFYSRQLMWEVMRGLFRNHLIEDWQTLYAAMIRGHRGGKLGVDSG